MSSVGKIQVRIGSINNTLSNNYTQQCKTFADSSKTNSDLAISAAGAAQSYAAQAAASYTQAADAVAVNASAVETVNNAIVIVNAKTTEANAASVAATTAANTAVTKASEAATSASSALSSANSASASVSDSSANAAIAVASANTASTKADEAVAAANTLSSSVTTLTNHVANTSNPHSVTKEQVGLSNVTNDAQVKRSEMGVASGVAVLGSDTLLASAYLGNHAAIHAIGARDEITPTAIGALGLSCASEVSITGTISLDASAFGKMHVCTGTTADYTVTLPSVASNAGKLLGVRISGSCTKLVTLDGAGSETIDGAATRVLWAGESAVLLCDGAGWMKIAGKTIPMRARIYQGVAQAIPTGALTKTSLSQANYDIGYLSDVANYQVKIRRAGYYQVTGTATFANAISYQHYVTIDGSNIIATATSANNGYSPPTTGTLNLSAGAAIAQGVYQGTGSSQDTYVTAFPCSLTVIEVPTW